MKLYKRVDIGHKPTKEQPGQVINNYFELSEDEVLDMLILGRRNEMYKKTIHTFIVNREPYMESESYDVASFSEIKEYLKGYTVGDAQKIKVDVDVTEVKQHLNDNIELLNHEIVIGINKNLELPTVFIDGDKVEDGLVDLDLRWITSNGLPKPKSFRLNTLSKQNEEKRIMIKYEN